MTPDELAERLPGRWAVHATSFPMWLKGDRLHPEITYRIRRRDPLALDDVVEYRRESGGTRRIVGRDRVRGQALVWRGAGPLAVLRSRWAVTGVDGPVLAIRFERSLVTPSGVDVLVRVEEPVPELRRRVAERHEALGLAPEEFASLGWIRD